MWEVVFRGSDILLSTPAARRTLVWLHGLGDSAAGFAPLFQQHLQLPETNILLLTAPERPVTLNGGAVMRSWYDIVSLRTRTFNSEAQDSADLIVRELRALPPQPLYIGGFSQGACMSMFVGLQSEDLPIYGVVGLSGYTFPLKIPASRKETPVFLYHGKDDFMVAETMARQCYELELAGMPYTYTTEEGLEHSLSLQEIDALKVWLEALFAKERWPLDKI